MEDPTRQELAVLRQRVGRLERERRWWRVAGGACLAALLLAAAAPQPRVVDEVVTRRLSVVDAQGRQRAALEVRDSVVYVDPSGTVALNLYTAQGGMGTELALDDTGPYLILSDAQGKIGVELLADQNKRVLQFHHPQGKGAVRLTAGDMGPQLSLHDAQGTQRAALTVLTAGDTGPHLSLHDAQGQLRALLGRVPLETTPTGSVVERSESSVVLFDKDGKLLWRIP